MAVVKVGYLGTSDSIQLHSSTMKHVFASFFFVCLCQANWAQLPDGTISPDFTAIDLNGVEHNLYSYLDSGYQVLLDFSATWCGPCWNYHSSGVLEELYETHGPNGTNELRVFFIEGDDNTTQEDLEGTGASTTGDWITGTSYPIIDNGQNIFADFECTYYPTIYTVCPNKILTESGQASIGGHEAILNSATCMPASLSNDALLMDYVGQSSTCGDNPAALSVRLMNNGLDTLTSCTIQVSKLLPFNQTEVIGSADWEGQLTTYDFTVVDLVDATIDGETIFVFEVVSEDDNEGNNSTQGTVSASEEVANNIEIRLKTDGAPDQLGWEITDASGSVIDAVLPGTLNLEATTEYAWDVTLPDLGCYGLSLIDEGGDGLFNLATSMDGVGFLEVSSTDGETILDQDFFYQELDEFSVITFDMEVTEVTAIQETKAFSNFSFYPNPSSTMLTLEFETANAGDARLAIRNVTGQEIVNHDWGMIAAGNHRQTLDVEFLSAGTYIVELFVNQTSRSMILLHQ